MQMFYPVSGIRIIDDLFRLFRVYHFFWETINVFIVQFRLYKPANQVFFKTSKQGFIKPTFKVFAKNYSCIYFIFQVILFVLSYIHIQITVLHSVCNLSSNSGTGLENKRHSLFNFEWHTTFVGVLSV